MSEINKNTEQQAPVENVNSPEAQLENQVPVQEALEELAIGQSEQEQKLVERDQRMAELEQRLAEREQKMAELEQKMAEQQMLINRLQVRPTGEEAQPEAPRAVEVKRQPEAVGSPEKEAGVEQKSDTQRDLERLSQMTGRPVDDPELVKLNLKIKYEQFERLTDAYDAQEGTVRQEGFMQDVATAKRELEEAMYLYEPKFAEMRQQYERTLATLERTTDPAERAKLREELFRLKDAGNVKSGNEERPGGAPRRELADKLTDRLGDISASLDGSEILATYELHKNEYPEAPISTRRRTDTVDWKGHSEYENGIYVGSSPGRTGDWVLEPKAPIGLAETVVEEPSEPTLEVPAEGGPEGPAPTSREDEGGGTPEDQERERRPIEVPPIDPGEYPELYARRKNLAGGDKEALRAEADRVASELTANVEARVNNYILENPDATPEQIRQFSLSCYVEAQNGLQQDIIAAIDGKGYTDAEGVERGRSSLRRFGAWLDRHGNTIKKVMLVAGVAGAVVLTGGIAAGAIVPAFAIGAGTAYGAVKGAAIGLGMSRHGSKESASRNVEVREMTPEEVDKYNNMSEYIMSQYNAAADADHKVNVKKSRRAAIMGAVVGAIAGSISFQSPETVNTTQTIDVPNKPPTLPSYEIQQGELTGKALQEYLGRLGIDGSRFVNADGSTNMHAIYNVLDVTPKQWHNMATLPNGTHSMAGADILADDGIRQVILTMVNQHNFGSHLETIGSSITQLVPNMAATIAGWVTGAILAAGAARKVAESVGPTAPPAEADQQPSTS